MVRRDSFTYKFKNNQPLLKSITWAHFFLHTKRQKQNDISPCYQIKLDISHKNVR